jgi:hypothetical protein
VSKQRYAQAAAAMAHAVHQPRVQLVTQRIKTAAGKSCLAFWDIGSQVTMTTHKAAREMGLEPIPGPPLNLMGVGDSQKTRSTVWYKIPLFDTGGRTVEVVAYGMDHIMAPLEAVDSTWMRAVFPEVPTRGLEAACGELTSSKGKTTTDCSQWGTGGWRMQHCIGAASGQGGSPLAGRPGKETQRPAQR